MCFFISYFGALGSQIHSLVYSIKSKSDNFGGTIFLGSLAFNSTLWKAPQPPVLLTVALPQSFHLSQKVVRNNFHYIKQEVVFGFNI